MSSLPTIYGMKPEIEWHQIHQWINQLQNPKVREEALRELVAKQSDTPDLAILLWENTATIYIFLQEIISPFSTINPADITDQQSERVCLTLQLLRTVAAHDETRLKFIHAKIPLYLYPFLNIAWTSEAFVRTRKISLDILNNLIATCDKEILTFLLSSNFIILLLRVIGGCSAISRNKAIITLHRILISDDALSYIIGRQELVDAIKLVLNGMLEKISPSFVTAIIILCLNRLDKKNI